MFIDSTPGGSLHFPASHSRDMVNGGGTAADIIAMALRKKFANTSMNNKSSLNPDSPHSPLVEHSIPIIERRPDDKDQQMSNRSNPSSPFKPLTSSNRPLELKLTETSSLPISSPLHEPLTESYSPDNELVIQSHTRDTPFILAS